ncbi:hypothetical protein [Geodermatophilus sp. SYSU D00696]
MTTTADQIAAAEATLVHLRAEAERLAAVLAEAKAAQETYGHAAGDDDEPDVASAAEEVRAEARRRYPKVTGGPMTGAATETSNFASTEDVPSTAAERGRAEARRRMASPA